MVKTHTPLGQHFLKNTKHAQTLAESVGAGVGDTILEIGPGTGMLTRELLKTGARVVAIERDTTLFPHLNREFAADIAAGRLTLIEQDVRDFDPIQHGLEAGRYVLAANIPYYITGEIIRQFLTAPAQPRAMSLLIQKEVARRIVDTKESLLSLSVKAYGTPKIIATVGRGNFQPPPQVDSAIILISNISHGRFTSVTDTAFFKVLHVGFAAKRKQLAGNLQTMATKEKILSAFTAAGIEEKARAEDVPLDKWLILAKILTDKS